MIVRRRYSYVALGVVLQLNMASLGVRGAAKGSKSTALVRHLGAASRAVVSLVDGGETRAGLGRYSDLVERR